MAVENLVYQGINRAPTDYVGVQACEELINMRPTQGGLCPVRDFGVKWANVNFLRLYVHNTTSGDKYIAVRRDGDAVYVSLLDEYGNPIHDLFDTPWDNSSSVDSIYCASAGNVFLITMCDKYNEVFKNAACRWDDDEEDYIGMDADVPAINYTVASVLETVEESVPTLGRGLSRDEVCEYVENGINAAQEHNPGLCLGPIIIATAFKTNDGQTFWTTGWRSFDPVPDIDDDEDMYVDANSSWSGTEFIAATGFFTKYGHGYAVSGTESQIGGVSKIYLEGAKVTLTFPKIGTQQVPWDKETSILKSLEVYSSRPATYLDATSAADGLFVGMDQNPVSYLAVAQRKYEDMELWNQLLYLQASIPLDSLAESQQTVELTFGGNIQVTDDTLRADTGATRRFGKVLSYNARFHFFDSVAKTTIGVPYFQQHAAGVPETADVFVRYSGPGQDGLYYVGTSPFFPSLNLDDEITRVVVAPSLCIQEVVVMITGSGVWHLEHYRMTPSATYNYAVCVDGPYEIHDPQQSSVVKEYTDAKGRGTGITVEEKTAINVSEQYNPFVFRVEHSYVAPAAVLDVQPQMSSSVDNSYGTYPLNVFTERGLYALIQGSANVLYGAFDPLSSLVAKKGVPLEMGTFFLSAGNLWLVSGRRLTLVSDALSRGPNKHVRACDGYKRLSGDKDGVVENPVYDVSRFVSAVTFEDFTKGEGAGLSYNRIREELYVSNPAYSYTYVISIKYRQWYKLSQYIRQDESGSSVAFVHRWDMTAGRNDVVDFNVETGGRPTVHMQTRPFSMAYSYSHVHRIVAMARAALEGTQGDRIVAALYGSDDLHSWKLLAYAYRAPSAGETLLLSQLRTTSSSRSWRYYTVCIGGQVPALASNQHESELGPILVDYEPVTRRIG